MRLSEQVKFQKRLPLTPTAYPSYHQPFASLYGVRKGSKVRFYRCPANFYRSTAKFYRSTANFTGPPLFGIGVPLHW